jgi:hypothetical protein
MPKKRIDQSGNQECDRQVGSKAQSLGDSPRYNGRGCATKHGLKKEKDNQMRQLLSPNAKMISPHPSGCIQPKH